MPAYIAGNGTSRRPVSLSKVKEKGTLYGCNSLYTEIIPHVLIATDPAPSDAIQRSGYALNNEFHTRNPYADKGAHKLKQPYAGWSSGPNAVQLAILQGHRELYLFGFDFGSVNDRFNNMYAGMEFYKKADDPATFGGNWINQIYTIIRQNPKIKFNIVKGPETNSLDQFKNFENVKILTIDEFLIHINNI